VTVSLLKRFRNGRFASETTTATWIQGYFRIYIPAGAGNSRTRSGEKRSQLDAPNKDAAAFAPCTKNLHVDTWSWVIGHGELESGVYFDQGGRRAARLVFFSLPRRAAQRQRPAWFTVAAFSGCLWPPRAARRALKRGHTPQRPF
jgi:hypothetical protein